MLELKNICVKEILNDLNLKVEGGKSVVIVGENGTGKSTLFSVISGAINPERGSAFINDIDLIRLPQYKISSLVSNVLQDPKLGTIGCMTILENLNIAYMRGKARNIKIRKNLKEFFKDRLSILKMDLENRLEEYVGNLSGGQRQALSLAMATLSNYEILLLDEITSALDPKASDLIVNIAENIVEVSGKTCISITHDLKYIGKTGSRIFRLKNGQLYLL